MKVIELVTCALCWLRRDKRYKACPHCGWNPKTQSVEPLRA